MKKSILKAISAALILITVFSTLTIGAFAAVPKTGYTVNATYTVNGNSYQCCTLKKAYNGVSAGSVFYLASGKVVTDKAILPKLRLIYILNSTRKEWLDTAKLTISALSQVTDLACAFTRNNLITDLLGSAGVNLIKLVATGSPDAVISLASKGLDPELVTTAVTLSLMKRYAAEAVRYGNLVIPQFSAAFSDYDKTLKAYKNLCNLLGNAAAANEIGLPIVKEAAGIGNAYVYTFKKLSDSICGELIPWHMVTEISDAVKKGKSVLSLCDLLGCEAARISKYNKCYSIVTDMNNSNGTELKLAA